MARPVAESQLATTPWQPLALSHQGLQTRLWWDPRQKDTRDPELPEDLGGCALFAAPVRFHWGGFLGNLRPATQVFPALIAGHGQNDSPPDSVARSHEGHASTPRHLCDRPDNSNGSVVQPRQWPQSRKIDPLRSLPTPSSFRMCASNAHDDGSDWPLTHRHSSH